MYIALKWLISFVLVMWLVLCFLDVSRKKNSTRHLDYEVQKPYKSVYNTTRYKVHKKLYMTKRIKIPNDSHYNLYLQYLMFLAGACMVTAFNRKNEIVRYTTRKIYNFKIDLTQCLKNPAKLTSAAIVKFYKIIVAQLWKASSLNVILLLFNNLKRLQQERRNLSKLLISRNQKIGSMGRGYLEALMKDDDELDEVSKTQVKEDRATNTNYQQLFLVTYQQNIFLKFEIKKLIKEKEDAERKLIKLINQVCRSKNNDLKVYCSQFIVQTKNNLLNSDVKAEIDKFLLNYSDNIEEIDQSSKHTSGLCNSSCASEKCNDCIEDKVPAVRNTRNQRGQCGEYVWTVKDKDGIIEKLYQCAGDFHDGDKVKRIRQYSVYYDTECFLDISNSTTFVNSQDTDVSNSKSKYPNFKLTVTSRRFLSSSQAFQNFLQSNNTTVKQGSRSSNSTICLSH